METKLANVNLSGIVTQKVQALLWMGIIIPIFHSGENKTIGKYFVKTIIVYKLSYHKFLVCCH